MHRHSLRMRYICAFIFAISVCGNGLANKSSLEYFINKPVKPYIQTPPLPQRPFLAVWNVNTENCKKTYDVNIDLSSFDIVNNPNETRDGDNMMIFYNSLLGFYPHFDDNGAPVNGGIPQLGNLTAHYEQCVKDIELYLPDEDFHGLAVIDWESWRPLWDRNGWGEGKIYQNASIAKVEKEHPDWPSAKVTAQAKLEFEEAAKSYMLGTLELAELMRPKAAWGYYLFPDCYNYDQTGSNLTCRNEVVGDNNRIQWLFNGSTALYPSTYLGIWFKNKETAIPYVANRVDEAKRVDRDRNSLTSVPIYVYNNLVYRKTKEFLSLEDVRHSSGIAAVLGASGVVLWGDYMSNSLQRCKEVKEYVEMTLGPYLKLASDSAAGCSFEMCSGHGRCVVANPSMYQSQGKASYLMKLFLQLTLPADIKYDVICQCYDGYEGSSCKYAKH